MTHSLKENNPPRSKKNAPRGVISSTLVDIPLPCKNEDLEKVKKDISELEVGRCLKYETTKERSLYQLQKYISTICSNYSRKMDMSIRFTVRIIDEKSIGVWRLSI